MDTTFKFDTALNLDCDQILDMIWVSDTKQMSRSYKSIMQYCAINDFFFKLFKNLEFEEFWRKKMKTTTTPFFVAISPKPDNSLYIIYKLCKEVNPNIPNIVC